MRFDRAGFVPVAVVNTKVSRQGPTNSSRSAANAVASGAGRVTALKRKHLPWVYMYSLTPELYS